MSCSLVCRQCGHHQSNGTFDPFKSCEKCDAGPESLGIESDETFDDDEVDDEDDEDE